MITLAAPVVLSDVRTFVARAGALGCEHVRITARGTAIALTVAALWRESLLEATPTILGMRVMERGDETTSPDLDTVIGLAQLRDRVARESLTIVLPPRTVGVMWAGVAPPIDGWHVRGSVDENDLERVARDGIAEVSRVSGQGSRIVSEVRRTVWSRVVECRDATAATVPGHSLPAGVGLVGYGLGFLAAGERGQVAAAGAWTRVTTRRGHMLVRSAVG